MNRLLSIAKFLRVTDNDPKQETPKTWAELCARLSHHRERVSKEGVELWSAAQYREGASRNKPGVAWVDCFVIDFDNGETKHDPAPLPHHFAALWAGREVFIHTTHGHTDERPRWRAIFPLSRSVAGEEWPAIWGRLMYHLADGLGDSACRNCDRMFYLPCHPTGAPYFATRLEGDWLNPDAFSDPPPVPKPIIPIGSRARIANQPEDIRERMLQRALQIAGQDSRHGGCIWLMRQCHDNRLSTNEARALGEQYATLCGGANTKGEPEEFSVTEMEGCLEWGYAQTQREPWKPRTWEETVPMPEPPPEPKRETPAEARHLENTIGEAPPPDEPPPPTRSTRNGDEGRSRRTPLLPARELMAKTLPSRRYAVPGILPEGLGIFAGKTKTGKSWAALGMAVAIASGGVVFGKHKVEQGDVLYLALEDNEESLQERLGLLLQGEEAPERLTFALEWRRTNEGGIGDIEAWLKGHPDARLVIVDVLTKIRPRSRGGSNNQQYEEDYEVCDPLKKLADTHRVAILLLHHLRKLTSEDPLDQILGSVGMSGAPDTTWVFRRARKDPKASLLVTGRRIKEEQERALEWDAAAVSWIDLGDADELNHSAEQEEILAFLRESPGMKKPKQIADALGKNAGTVRKLCQKLKDDGKVVSDGWGTYGIKETLF